MQPPKQIGRYLVDRVLGVGAMGSVFLGRDPALDRPVAIKTVKPRAGGREEADTFRTRFRNEARAAARLQHPSIVQVYDVGEDDEVGPYIVSEFVSGFDLREILQSRGPLNSEAAVRLAEQVGEALDTAHTAGIIHRDVKPDNLLVMSDGRVKLADFGIARLPDAALTQEGQFLGTPCYAAPETLQRGGYGPSSDQFSLAAVLYEAVSGVRAFPGTDAVAVVHSVVHDQPIPPSKVVKGAPLPPQIDSVLLRGLSKNPKERYENASALARAFRNAYEAAGTLSDDSSSRGTLRNRGVGERRAVALALTLIIFGFLAIGVAVSDVFRGKVSDKELSQKDPALLHRRATSGRRKSPEPKGVSSEERNRKDGGGPAWVWVSPDADPSSTAQDEGPFMDKGPLSKDREELAKEELVTVRRLIAQGAHDEARSALERARKLDPSNPDVAALGETLSKHADP